MTIPQTTVTSTGLAPNVAGALSYVLGPITGIAFLEMDNRFVRFHPMQSVMVGVIAITFSIAVALLAGILAIVPVIGWIIGFLISFGLAITSFVLWLLLMWRAYQGSEWEAPLAGKLARKKLGS